MLARYSYPAFDCALHKPTAISQIDGMEILKVLEKTKISLEVLTRTKIGMTVNNFRKSSNSNPETVSLAKTLIRNWKRLIPGKYFWSSCLCTYLVCVRTLFVYLPCLCTYLVCVRTLFVYVPCLCTYLVCVPTLFVYIPCLCTYLVCVPTLFVYVPCLCTYLVPCICHDSELWPILMMKNDLEHRYNSNLW